MVPHIPEYLLILECRGELIKPGNSGIKNTVEQADDLFVHDGTESVIGIEH